MKLVEKKVNNVLQHEKQVLIYKLKRFSEISAFGFFTIDRGTILRIKYVL